MNKRKFSSDEAKQIGVTLGIDWARIDLDQFRRGLEVEFEHGAPDPASFITPAGSAACSAAPRTASV